MTVANMERLLRNRKVTVEVIGTNANGDVIPSERTIQSFDGVSDAITALVNNPECVRIEVQKFRRCKGNVWRSFGRTLMAFEYAREV